MRKLLQDCYSEANGRQVLPSIQLIESEGKYQKSHTGSATFDWWSHSLAQPWWILLLVDFARRIMDGDSQGMLIANRQEQSKRSLNYIQKVFLEDFWAHSKNSRQASDILYSEWYKVCRFLPLHRLVTTTTTAPEQILTRLPLLQLPFSFLFSFSSSSASASAPVPLWLTT